MGTSHPNRPMYSNMTMMPQTVIMPHRRPQKNTINSSAALLSSTNKLALCLGHNHEPIMANPPTPSMAKWMDVLNRAIPPGCKDTSQMENDQSPAFFVVMRTTSHGVFCSPPLLYQPSAAKHIPIGRRMPNESKILQNVQIPHFPMSACAVNHGKFSIHSDHFLIKWYGLAIHPTPCLRIGNCATGFPNKTPRLDLFRGVLPYIIYFYLLSTNAPSLPTAQHGRHVNSVPLQ